MTGKELREKFLNFFKDRGHVVVPSSSLLSDDPSVLLTTAGMQQFKPYFMGDADPEKDFDSRQVVSIQKVFRTVDIDTVGDESHLTFFEMLGNFSFGDYFKEKAIPLSFEFITSSDGLGLNPENLYVTAFKGDEEVPRDDKAIKLWQEQFKSVGIEAKIGERIFLYGRKENWWEVGPGPAGPDSEMFYDTGKKHDQTFGPNCGPACDCGKFIEIGNDVFIQYEKIAEGEYKPLGKKSVDNGRGFERLVMVAQGKDNVFETDLIKPILAQVPKTLSEKQRKIVADHVRGTSFLISDGVSPSNKEAGYVLRRLMRRIIAYNIDLSGPLEAVVSEYKSFYPNLDVETIKEVYADEENKFSKSLERGLRELEKLDKINAEVAFNLYQSFGLPYEVIKDKGGKKAASFNREDFDAKLREHQKVSRAGANSFKGGLADNDPKTIRLHTAHHLLLAALQEIVDPSIKQRGSHITQKRLRMDFTSEKAIEKKDLKKIEDLVNKKIEDNLEVIEKKMPKEEAEKVGAEMEFGTKYPDIVSVYFIKDKDGKDFSKEFCGGPHVKKTGEIGNFTIQKEESAGAGVRRIRATID